MQKYSLDTSQWNLQYVSNYQILNPHYMFLLVIGQKLHFEKSWTKSPDTYFLSYKKSENIKYSFKFSSILILYYIITVGIDFCIELF